MSFIHKQVCRGFALLLFFFTGIQEGRSQFLIDMIDTTLDREKNLWSQFQKYDHLIISGYLQPQYQVAQEKGVEVYSGGNFADQSNNRFMFRRGRVKFDYAHFTKDGKPSAQVVFQVDGTERGVNIRDIWGRFFENKWELFSVTTGLFARPFGYEVNLSSQVRETPERGRMSQILMKTERDLGAMVSFEPRKKDHSLKFLKFDIGVFNGQGLAGPAEFDSYKDIISRLSFKPKPLYPGFTLTAGLSFLRGALSHNSPYYYVQDNKGGGYRVDSAAGNYGSASPRQYYGADIQGRWKHGWGKTIIRAEYWWGKQSGTAESSETPGELPENSPFFIREFNGGFAYLLQDIINEKNQAGIKVDFYDPNTMLTGKEILPGQTGHGRADIKYSTFSVGFNRYFNDHLKLLLWYDIIRNENTGLPGYMDDLRDNVLTCRIQYQF